MKFIYFNDRDKPTRINLLTFADSVTVQPLEQKAIELDVPDGAVLWIKQWSNGDILASWKYQEVTMITNRGQENDP